MVKETTNKLQNSEEKLKEALTSLNSVQSRAETQEIRANSIQRRCEVLQTQLQETRDELQKALDVSYLFCLLFYIYTQIKPLSFFLINKFNIMG